MVAPPAVKCVVSRAAARYLKKEGDRRQRRDGRSMNGWTRGMLSDAHLIGLLSEFAAGDYLHQALSTAKDADGGIDFHVDGIAVDVKCTSKMDMPAVRVSEIERKLKKRSANMFVFSKRTGELSVQLLGWLTLGELASCSKEVQLPSGRNYQPSLEALRDMSQIRQWLKGSPVRGLLRYPGGKGTIIKSVAGRTQYTGALFAPEWYIEPFVGGGSMLAHLINERLCPRRIWINDLDTSLMLLYTAVRDRHGELCSMILRSPAPTVEDWYLAKEKDGELLDAVLAGYLKLVLHYCGHAGIGYRSGGPQGGAKQDSNYPIGCRWHPAGLVRKIQFFHRALKGAKITNLSVFDMDFPVSAFVFLDPPYAAQGPSLYRHSFDEGNHRRLSEKLSNYRGDFALTYDDDPLVRELYQWAEIAEFAMTTGNNHARKYQELVITRRG